MKHLFLIAATYATLVLQATVGGQSAIAEAAPLFPLLALGAALALTHGASAIVWGSIIGFGCDCLGSGPLGREMFVFGAVALVGGGLFSGRFGRSVPGTFLAMFVVGSLALSLSAAWELLPEGRPVDLAALARQIALSAAITAVLAAVVRALWRAGLRLLGIPIATLPDERRAARWKRMAA